MKDFPKSSLSHEIDRNAYNILSEFIPDEWITRQITGQDYGIDLYVEIRTKLDHLIIGDMIALQVKGKTKIPFDGEGNFTYRPIKPSTINYWLGLPMPVFFVIVCLETKMAYWVNIKKEYREDQFGSRLNKFRSIRINKLNTLRKGYGINKLHHQYRFEKNWDKIENCIIKSLMTFTSLGPFILICRRKEKEEECSTVIQYLLIEYYNNYTTFDEYYGRKKNTVPILHWYKENEDYYGVNKNKTFSYETVHNVIDHFIKSYWNYVQFSNELFLRTYGNYFQNKYPLVFDHLKRRPLKFIISDWYAQYYYDEYEKETEEIEKIFFKDFTEFD